MEAETSGRDTRGNHVSVRGIQPRQDCPALLSEAAAARSSHDYSTLLSEVAGSRHDHDQAEKWGSLIGGLIGGSAIGLALAGPTGVLAGASVGALLAAARSRS